MLAEWQEQLGTTADGRLSSQSDYNRREVQVRIESGVYDGSYNTHGSSMVRGCSPGLALSSTARWGTTR